MAIPFTPPEWLIKEYMDRKSEGQQILDSGLKAAELYMGLKDKKAARELKAQEIEIAKQEAERKNTEMAYNYGDQRYLPQNIQDQLNAGAPIGPENRIPVDYGEAQQAQLGGAQGPAVPMEQVIPPKESAIVRHFRDFFKENEFGLKGQQYTQDTIYNKDSEGNMTPTVVRRPIKGKTIVSGPQSHGLGVWRPLYRTGNTITQQHSVSGEMREVPAPGDNSVTPQPVVPPSIPSGAIEKTASQTGFINLLDEIEKNYDPSFVGPIQARARKAAQRYDLPGIGLGASNKAADFERSIADLRSAIVNERTGAAVGERQEWDRLLELIPDDLKSDTDFRQKTRSIRQRYNQIIANRASAYQTAGYRSPIQGGSTPAAAPTEFQGMSDEELDRIANGG